MRQIRSTWAQGTVLVCTHERGPDEKPSCGLQKGTELRSWLKERIHEEGLKGQILASKTSCLGVCSKLGATVELVPAPETGRPRATLLVDTVNEREELWAAAKACLLEGRLPELGLDEEL